jgi:AcrR family transcriptional regulator
MIDDQPRGRGRPKGTGRIDPDDIINAALDALAQGGYLGLTMRGVARSLDVSLTAVQNHFPTKDDLWRACIDHLVEATSAPPQVAETPTLIPLLEHALQRGSTRPGLLAAVLTDTAPGSAERIAYVAERSADILTNGAKRLIDLESTGLVRPVDHRAFQALLLIGIRSIGSSREAMSALFGYDLAESEQRSELALALADILANGLLPRE